MTVWVRDLDKQGHQSGVLHSLLTTNAMAENIYSKGTRVWFEDKELAWLSAEVTQVTKGADDAIKLVFVDERGKVNSVFNLARKSSA